MADDYLVAWARSRPWYRAADALLLAGVSCLVTDPESPQTTSWVLSLSSRQSVSVWVRRGLGKGWRLSVTSNCVRT